MDPSDEEHHSDQNGTTDGENQQVSSTLERRNEETDNDHPTATTRTTSSRRRTIRRSRLLSSKRGGSSSLLELEKQGAAVGALSQQKSHLGGNTPQQPEGLQSARWGRKSNSRKSLSSSNRTTSDASPDSFLSEKEYIARRSTRSLIRYHKQVDAQFPLPRSPEPMKDPAIITEEGAVQHDVLALTGIIVSQQPEQEDAATAMQQLDARSVALPPSQVKSSIAVRSAARRRDRMRRGTAARDAVSGSVASHNNHSSPSSSLTHATQRVAVENRNSATAAAVPMAGATGAFRPNYVNGEEIDDDDEEEEYGDYENVDSTTQPQAAVSERQYGRSRAHDIEDNLAVASPIENEDEIMQAHVLRIDSSSNASVQNTNERQLQQKTKRMWLRFAAIFLLVLVVGIVVVILVVGNDDGTPATAVPSQVPSVTPSVSPSSVPTATPTEQPLHLLTRPPGFPSPAPSLI